MERDEETAVCDWHREPPPPEASTATRRGFLAGSAAVVGGAVTAGTAAAQQSSDTVTVVVGPGGDLVFDPADLEIPPGTTVEFLWDSDLHNIVVESQPDDGDWSGTEGGESKTYDTGHEYSHTFEVEGTYEYYCAPHRAAGMEATIVVDPEATLPGAGDGGDTGTGDGGDTGFEGAWMVSAIGIGLTAIVVAAVYYWDLYAFKAPPEMRSAADRRDAVPVPEGEAGGELGTIHGGPMYEAAPEQRVTETVDSDAFDPVGTVALLIGYFLLVALLWLFMYFVEFLGNGPEVIG